jgi:dihydroorotate dehydrogenase
VVVKFSPDFLNINEFETLLKASLAAGVDGVIVTNTTNDPEILECVPDEIKKQGGGLSGMPLREKAEKYLKHAVKICGKRIPVISSGGVMTKEDVWNRLQMGAAVVQVYTGFIYNGPGFVPDCQDYILRKLMEAGYESFGDYLKTRKPA